MSVNDLMNDDNFLVVLSVGFIIFSIILISWIQKSREKADEIYGGNDYGMTTYSGHAKVLARRTSPNPLSPTVMVNMIVFEMENGSRVELAIKESAVFGTIVEGDCGILRYQGKRFISFERGA